MFPLRLFLGLLSLVGGLALSWAAWSPLPAQGRDLALQRAFSQAALPPFRGRLWVRWPTQIRLGDQGQVQMALTWSPTPEEEAAFAPYLLRAEVRLESSGLLLTPQGEVSEPLAPGQPLRLAWRLVGHAPGPYRGRLWVHLVLTNKGGTPRQRQAAAAIPWQGEVIRPLGLSGPQARALGGSGVVAGLLLLLPEGLARRRAHLGPGPDRQREEG